MSKRKVYIVLVCIFILAFFAGNLVYPQFLKLPHFPDIPFKLGLDLRGGTHLIYKADLSNIVKEDYSSSLQGLRDVIERRVNFFGVGEPLVQTQGEKLIVELAGIKEPAEAIRMIGQTPYLEFKEEKENYQAILEKNTKVAERKEGEYEDPFQATPLTGKYLKKAELGFDQTTYKSLVLLQFNAEGSQIFEDLTSKWVGKPLAIYIDGIPISSPIVQEKISGGKAQITGNFTVDEAKELVRNLNAGALPLPISLISQQTVGPTLGEVSLQKSLKAGIYGFLAVTIFMILFYRLPGAFASLSLLIYVFFLLALFKLIPVTLTLAGIAGFILSMGMAVDANVLIFSRVREELKQGKSYLLSLEEGSKRAWSSIRDGNFTTILVGLILFGFGSSFIKGFALTLIIGNLVGMFTAIVITNNLLRCFPKDKSQRWIWLWR